MDAQKTGPPTNVKTRAAAHNRHRHTHKAVCEISVGLVAFFVRLFVPVQLFSCSAVQLSDRSTSNGAGPPPQHDTSPDGRVIGSDLLTRIAGTQGARAPPLFGSC